MPDRFDSCVIVAVSIHLLQYGVVLVVYRLAAIAEANAFCPKLSANEAKMPKDV